MKNPLTKFANTITVGAKIYAVVGICLLCMAGLGGISYWQMDLIGKEIEAIAERDLPIARAVNNVTLHQLEQSIAFERSAALAGRSAKKFEELAKKVDGELVTAIEFGNKAKSEAHTPAERAIFASVVEELKIVERQHKGFNKNGLTALKFLDAGDAAKAHALQGEIEDTASKLNHSLEELSTRIVGFTDKAAKTAEAHEKSAIMMIAIVALIGFLAAAATAFLIVRFAIGRPLGEVVGGLDALNEGNYEVEIPVRSQDEIGKVAAALQSFRDTLIRSKQLEEEQKIAEQKAQQAEKERIEAEREAAAKEAADQERAAQEAAARAENMEKIIASFDQEVSAVLETVSSAATEMRASAESLTKTADHTSQQSSAVAAASEESATNLQTVASAAEELSASVGEISRQVSESSRIAQSAVAEASSTNQKVQGLAEARGNRRSDRRHPERHRRGRDCDRGHLERDRPDQRDLDGHRLRGRGAGRRNPGYRRQCPAGRRRHAGGQRQYRGGQPGRRRNRTVGERSAECRGRAFKAGRIAAPPGRRLPSADKGCLIHNTLSR